MINKIFKLLQALYVLIQQKADMTSEILEEVRKLRKQVSDLTALAVQDDALIKQIAAEVMLPHSGRLASQQMFFSVPK